METKLGSLIQVLTKPDLDSYEALFKFFKSDLSSSNYCDLGSSK